MVLIIYILLFLLILLDLLKMFISLFGFAKVKRDYEMKMDQKTFLFVIPACNEENVIQDSLLSLKNLDYNKNLYNVTTLVNNSTDNTLAISRKSGFRTFEIGFDEGEAKGKPHVLRKFFEQKTYWKNYEYIVILDADNIVSKNYLKEINSQIVSREEKGKKTTVVQGYLGMKNIFVSFMSAGYASSYFIANRMYQLAKYRLGMNASIGGTGFAINSSYICENGWNPRSYTEDFELQVELSLKGEKSIWNHFAVVYDEKPTTFKTSHIQRMRWSQGHWYIALTTTFKQILSMFNFKKINTLHTKFETLAYSYSLARPVIWIIIIITSLFITIPEELRLKLFSWSLIWIVIFLFNNVIVPIFALRLEANYLFQNQDSNILKNVKKAIILFLSGYYCGITYFIQQVLGFFTCFKKQNNWAKTTHEFNLDVVEMRQEFNRK